jgi:hypothetical protein
MRFVIALTILVCIAHTAGAQILGCTDPSAVNYFPAATNNDGSCTYPQTFVTPDTSIILSDTLDESSGLIMWNGYLWTHVDDTDPRLFAIDSSSGTIVRRDTMFQVTNIDMEEISQDSEYVYVGDFGNNSNGNRTDLRIYRFRKDSLMNGYATADTISFAYSDQTDFTPQGIYNTDFDCEAFIVTDDSIFLFTKEWNSFGCTVYAFAKDTGFHWAQPRDSFNIQGLVTGATYLPDLNLVALIGYSPLIQPWILLVYDYTGNRFFSGNKRKLDVAIGTSQTEAIATTDGGRFYITNEKRTVASITYPQQLHVLDLKIFTDAFIHSGISDTIRNNPAISCFPNPANDYLNITSPAGSTICIYNSCGQLVKYIENSEPTTVLNINDWQKGLYLIGITANNITSTLRLVAL